MTCNKHIKREGTVSFLYSGNISLTMCVDVSKLIVQIEETLDTLLDGGNGSITSQDIFVEL